MEFSSKACRNLRKTAHSWPSLLLVLLSACSGLGIGRRHWKTPGQALGTNQQPQTAPLELTGQCIEGARTLPFRWLLWPDGSWWRSWGGELEASDGERIWRRRASGEARWLGLKETLVRQAEHSLCFGGWAAESSPWMVSGQGRLGLDLRQEQGQLVARVEPARARPQRVSLPSSGFAARLGPWDAAGRAPLQLEISHAGGQTRTWRVEQVAVQEGDQRGRLAWPQAERTPAVARAPRILNAIVGPGGRLFLQPELEGRKLGLFLVDTAASISCIDPAAAGDLAWERVGFVHVQGVGGVRDGDKLKSGPISFGDWTVPAWPFVEVDLGDWLAVDGEPVVGLLGAPFFAGRVVVLDPRQSRVEIWDASDPALADWPWQACVLERGAPCIRASYSLNATGWFRLDTGSDDTISLHYRAVVAAGVMADRAAFMELPKARLGGIGGSAIARRGELDWVRLGTRRITHVPTSFLLERTGPMANPNLAGTFGAGLLSQFRVALDVDARRVAFLPSGF